MFTIKESNDHLSYLEKEFRRQAQRTDQARQTAIGLSDFGHGNAHDPALNEHIDWFYRRWVQRVEIAAQYVLSAADRLEQARQMYELTDGKLREAAMEQLPRRQGADL